MAIIFYYAPRSSSMRVHWALEELGVAYEKIKVDLHAGAHKRPEFLAINPNGKVPALVVDGAPMFESLAMLLHLGERFGVDSGLWPRPGTAEHIEALTWTVWGTVTAGGSLWRLLYNTAEWFSPESRNAIQAELAREEFSAALVILEARLDGREHLVGDRFTLVDIANTSLLGLATAMFKFDLSPYPNISAWLARCSQRPAHAVASAD